MILLLVLLLSLVFVSRQHRWPAMVTEATCLEIGEDLITKAFSLKFEIVGNYFDFPKANPRGASGRYGFKPTVPT